MSGDVLWETRCCPSCGSFNLPKKPEVSSRVRAENLPFSDVEDFFIGIRPGQVFFSYWRCSDCGLLYCPKYFNSSQLQAAYAKMPDNTMGNPEHLARLNQDRYAAWIFSNQTHAKHLLELGPDLGFLSSSLVREFGSKKVSFVEPNQEMHNVLSSISGPEEIHIQSRIDEELEASQIDLTVGVHVFDHLLDPVSKLREIRDRSLENAKVFFVVHNEASWLRFVLGKRFPPFCLQHPQLFSPRTAKKLFLAGGWNLTKHRKTVNSFDVENQLKMLLKVFGFNASWIKILRGFTLTVPFGNFIAEAKKVDNV